MTLLPAAPQGGRRRPGGAGGRWHLWRRPPPLRAGQRARAVALTAALKQHRIRRLDTAVPRERRQAPAVKLTPAAAEAAPTHVRLVVERLALVNPRQLHHSRGQREVVVHRLVEAAPRGETDSSTDTELDPFGRGNPVVDIGYRRRRARYAVSEGNDALLRRDYAAL